LNELWLLKSIFFLKNVKAKLKPNLFSVWMHCYNHARSGGHPTRGYYGNCFGTTILEQDWFPTFFPHT